MKKISPVILLVMLFTMFLVPRNVLAFSFDFSGTVLFDSKAPNGPFPGLGDDFQGSLLGESSLNFKNTDVPTFYQDFGSVTGGTFNQGGSDYYYAFSQGQDASLQMGMIWWSAPRNFTVVGRSFDDVYGLVFYLDGSTPYTSDQMVVWCLAENFTADSLQMLIGSGLSHNYEGASFFGVIEESLPVPLPASVWFLGSGLLLLVRRRKR